MSFILIYLFKNNTSLTFIFRVLDGCASEVGKICYFCMHIKTRNDTSWCQEDRMQLFKDAYRKKCCHFCILSLSQPQQFYYITSYQKGYFTINSYNLNFVNVDDCNIYAEFAKNVDLLGFRQGHWFLQRVSLYDDGFIIMQQIIFN